MVGRLQGWLTGFLTVVSTFVFFPLPGFFWYKKRGQKKNRGSCLHTHITYMHITILYI